MNEVNMELQLTNDEKYELLEINQGDLCEEIKKETFITQLYTIKDDELSLIEGIIGDSIELEIDISDSEDITRASFRVWGNQIVVIRSKKLNIKRLVELMLHAYEFSTGGAAAKIGVVLNILVKQFFDVLDDDVAIIYSHLCIEYFKNHRVFGNIEIFDEVNRYLGQNLGLNWSNDKINRILTELENLRVIEFDNGNLYVKDEIYFE